jgi:hypothetical protein
MKTLLTIAVLLIATAVYAATLQIDTNGNKIPLPAYDGAKTVNLPNTASRYKTVDLRQDIAYSVYCAGAAKERFMYGNYTANSAAAIAGRSAMVQSTVPATTWHGGIVNKNTPYVNFSTCVGTVRRH